MNAYLLMNDTAPTFVSKRKNFFLDFHDIMYI